MGCPLLDWTPTMLTALVDPPDPRRTAGRLWDRAFGGLPGEVHPPLSGNARRAPARPRQPAAGIRVGRGDHPLDRWVATGEGTRDPLRGEGADPAARLVRRTLDLRHGGRG